MPDLLLEIRISRGEPWRNIATGVWPAGGSLILGQPTEHLPPEIDQSFSIYEITLKGREPNTGFLRLKQDLLNFEILYRTALASILSNHGKLGALHLFPAVPAPIAVSCGYDLLPKIYPAIIVYDYDKSTNGFSTTIRINEP